MPVPAGTQLGRYTVLKPLVAASEGPTEVLLGRAQGPGGFAHHVVIKAVRAGPAADRAYIDAFVDEARLSASLHHSHIVQVHDVGRADDIYFFAMEYVHGETLRALLTKIAREGGFVPLDQLMTIVLGVAAGLHYAHQQNIVHRDVTPANILVGYDGHVKVTDFGIAKALLKSSDATRSGTMRGKVAYMSPEQCLGRPVDRRADIFALGIVLYELCTSRRLFKGETDFLVMTSIVNGKIPKPTQHRSDLPRDLEDVIMKALAPKPELRFATAEDFALELERVCAANQIRVSPPSLAEYLAKQLGTRQEPWLVETKLEAVDVDFDGGGSGLVEIDAERSSPALERELMQSPLLSPYDDHDDELEPFGDDGATEIQDPDQLSGFELNERTLLGDHEDVAMLANLSRITPVGVVQPMPTPLPMSAQQMARSERSQPMPPMTERSQPLPPMSERSQPLPPMPSAPPQWNASPSGTGTPMAWSADGDVPSLRPNTRRGLVIAAIALPVLVIGIALLARGGDSHAPARTVEPDAFVAPDAPPPDAALPDAKPAASAKPAKH